MLNDPDVSDLLNCFKTNISFQGLRALEQQMEVLKNNTQYIEPREIPLGKRIENRINKTSNSVPRTVFETCQYVSVIDSLAQWCLKIKIYEL